MILKAGREGGLQNLEIQGILKLRISDSDHGLIKIQVGSSTVAVGKLEYNKNYCYYNFFI